MEPDFSGYATKADIKCSDGRTIKADAFAHQDKVKVPLVWQHAHNEPNNVLGHAILEKRDDGVYCYGYFNDTEQGVNAKKLVQHGDISALSIYANQLVEKAKTVLHGAIKEVSLVLSGANPGALIDNVRLAHSDGEVETIDDEAVIYTGLTLAHSADAEVVPSDKKDEGEHKTEDKKDDEVVEHAEKSVEELERVYDTFTDDQKEVVHFFVGAAVAATEEELKEKGVAHSDENPDNTSTTDPDNKTEDTLAHQEGTDNMPRNAFDQNGTQTEGPTLSHDDIKGIVADAQKIGSFKEAFLAHAEANDYGIADIDMLFPDAKSVTTTPEFISRRMEWVASVLDGAKHSPFSRIKSVHADITADEARARGYVKGNLKKEEIIRLLKRVTTPTTVYKKQKLDRDDIVDITDFDVVVWLKGEMRLMLEEELARAILIGDGREPDDEDKIDEEKLRPIAWDDAMYAHPVTLPAEVSPEGIVESVLRARKHYKGTGRPSFFTTDDILTDMILLKDRVGRRLYNTEAELAAALRVDRIVVVEVMENTPDLLGVIVNMADYTIGADRGGQLSMFDDFDIDYNQYKYLMETRISGALTKAKSAVVIKRTSGTTVTPDVPAFDAATNTLTVPATAGVAYYDVTDPTNETALADGASVTITRTTDVEARPEAGYNFPHNTDNDWTFAYTGA